MKLGCVFHPSDHGARALRYVYRSTRGEITVTCNGGRMRMEALGRSRAGFVAHFHGVELVAPFDYLTLDVPDDAEVEWTAQMRAPIILPLPYDERWHRDGIMAAILR